MDDVAMRRRLAALVIAALLAMLVVSGALLFGMGEPAQAQSVPEPPCTTPFCIDKTADPDTVVVDQQITFTITQRCPFTGELGCSSVDTMPIVDTLPPEAEFTIVSVAAASPGGTACTTDVNTNTVRCGGNRFFTETQPFTLTIVATPTECGTFTNTASYPVPNNPTITGSVTFTVEGCAPTTPATKDLCKNGGWKALGWPDQGTCVSAVNRQNRQ
jgi:hypothetical protein